MHQDRYQIQQKWNHSSNRFHRDCISKQYIILLYRSILPYFTLLEVVLRRGGMRKVALKRKISPNLGIKKRAWRGFAQTYRLLILIHVDTHCIETLKYNFDFAIIDGLAGEKLLQVEQSGRWNLVACWTRPVDIVWNSMNIYLHLGEQEWNREAYMGSGRILLIFYPSGLVGGGLRSQFSASIK